jgi:hypothetical protein
MYKFNPLNVGKLSITDLGGLSIETIEAGKKAAPQLGELGIKALDVLIDADTAFRNRLILVKGSPITAQIKNADDRRDNGVSETWRMANAAAKSSIEANANAGKILVTFLQPYHNVQKAPLMSETSTINFMKEKYLADQDVQNAAATLQLDTVFTTIFTANDEVFNLWDLRVDEDADKIGLPPSRLRINLEKAYRKFSDVTLQTLDLSPSPQMERLFVAMNEIRIKYTNPSPARITEDNTSIMPIGIQKYTGSAITPIPTVLLKTEDGNFKELQFSVDFYITYRNNVNIGEAKLIIHGKGKYKGSYTSSFFIEK